MRDRIEAELNEARLQWRADLRASENRMAEHLSRIDRDLGEDIAEIDATERTLIQPVIEREVSRDPTLADPDNGISDELRDAINAAAAASACTAATDCADGIAMPGAGGAGGQ